MVNPSAFAADGGDPRLHGAVVGQADYVAPRIRKLHDSSIMFEEYLYYAELTRAEEDAGVTSSHADGEKTGVMSTIFSSKSSKVVKQDSHDGSLTNEKMAAATQLENHHQASDDEWTNAARALRTATASAIFYLITTDILGPFGVPFAIGTTGWGPGVALYSVFGFLAAYSGWMLWKIFLGLDSYHYPLNTYGDLAFRIYGRTARYLMNSLQTIQLLCNVGAIIIANGQALSQVSKFKLCYAVCCLIWAIAGFAVGQVRTLQKYGWLANLAIWLNLLIIFMTMGVAAHSTPNYAAAQGASAGAALGGDLVKPDPTTGEYPPIVHFAGLPDPTNFIGAINGLMQGVYAYGGAMVFIEFMSEMKRPRDFLKGMAAAQLFIYFFYMLYGLFMYAYQGQYAVNPSYQGIEPYAWQSAGNVIAIVSGLIAAGLYGNIGVKVLYNNILIEFLHAPPLTSKKGKILWAAIIPVYWTLAFIIAASIPNFFGLTSLVAAVCILQFTYTFPPLLYLGYAIKKGAMLPGEGFDPATGRVVRHDAGVKRWARGFTKGAWYLNVWNIIYMLGAGVTAGLGAYSAIEALIAAFAQPQIGAFTCHSPLDNA
ncbi:hypothetical protein LTR50_007040 [Elasticomyces elasticus]|nr:hypothetical protein LTR50_007040 [Elasticomyces elasticus]